MVFLLLKISFVPRSIDELSIHIESLMHLILAIFTESN
ncbi:MAG: hypothetical protein ACJA1A_003431 [Saprospiraceae bacterium]|jgi:hypothetical protein